MTLSTRIPDNLSYALAGVPIPKRIMSPRHGEISSIIVQKIENLPNNRLSSSGYRL
jgi:hypothetical protein